MLPDIHPYSFHFCHGGLQTLLKILPWLGGVLGATLHSCEPGPQEPQLVDALPIAGRVEPAACCSLADAVHQNGPRAGKLCLTSIARQKKWNNPKGNKI